MRLLLGGSEGRSATAEEEVAALGLTRDETLMTSLNEVFPAVHVCQHCRAQTFV